MNENRQKVDRQIKISVIIPVYNIKDYVAKCLESLKNQTLDSYEVILIDDGSTDGSEKIVDEYVSDSRFIIRHVANSGVSAARNTRMELAKGRYVAFVDGDDYVESDYLETLYLAAEQDACDIVVCGRIVESSMGDLTTFALKDTGVFQNNQKLALLQGMLGYSIDDMKQWLKLRNFNRGTTVWARLYKSALLKENRIRFNENVKVAEDMIFNTEAYLRAKKIRQIDYCGYYYVQRSNSTLHKYLEDGCGYLVENKCQLALLRDCVCKKVVLDKKLQKQIKSMYAGSLILSCGEIAVSLASSDCYSLRKKKQLYKKYADLSMVKEARKQLGLSNLNIKYTIALALIKFNCSYLLLLGLALLKKMNVKIGL